MLCRLLWLADSGLNWINTLLRRTSFLPIQGAHSQLQVDSTDSEVQRSKHERYSCYDTPKKLQIIKMLSDGELSLKTKSGLRCVFMLGPSGTNSR
jgi:hypothetical protein